MDCLKITMSDSLILVLILLTKAVFEVRAVIPEQVVKLGIDAQSVCDRGQHKEMFLLRGQEISLTCNYSYPATVILERVTLQTGNKTVIYSYSPQQKSQNTSNSTRRNVPAVTSSFQNSSIHKQGHTITSDSLQTKLTLPTEDRRRSDVTQYKCSVTWLEYNGNKTNNKPVTRDSEIDILGMIIASPNKTDINNLFTAELRDLVLSQGFGNFLVNVTIDISELPFNNCSIPKVMWHQNGKRISERSVVTVMTSEHYTVSVLNITEEMISTGGEVHIFTSTLILFGVHSDGYNFTVKYTVPKRSKEASNWWIFFIIVGAVWLPVIIIIIHVGVKTYRSQKPKAYYKNSSPFFEIAL